MQITLMNLEKYVIKFLDEYVNMRICVILIYICEYANRSKVTRMHGSILKHIKVKKQAI